MIGATVLSAAGGLAAPSAAELPRSAAVGSPAPGEPPAPPTEATPREIPPTHAHVRW